MYEAPHALSRHEADARVEVAKAAESVLFARPPGTLPSVVFGTTCGPATPIAWTANLIEDASLTRLTCQPPT